MGKIKQLPPHEAHKIAAGEVVERPSNALKELTENSLDAGATSVTIYCEDAGKKLIRVIDSGSGMSAEDAHLCFAHHATSKISSVDDLIALHTFGFRGEALSSIAAVSKITLITREADATLGTKLLLEHGSVIAQEQVACAVGTDITISDLFFNVPARKKFLKTRETEMRAITTLFQAFCLSHLNVHFRLFSDGILAFNCPPAQSLKDRAFQLWDSRMSTHLLEFNAHDENKHLSISGLITDHQYYRYDRSCIFFFVNGRWIKSPQLNKALCKGYMNVLPADRLPAAFLLISLDPAHIDVNIHPRKEEVQFLNGKVLESLVQSVTKKTLESHLSHQLGKSVSFHNPVPEHNPSFFRAHAFSAPAMSDPFPVPAMPSFEPMQSVGAQTYQQMPVIPAPAFISEEKTWPTHFTLIGQLHKTYWLLEHDEGLFVIDQHAAHERILYERFSQRFEDVSSVALIFPQVVTLSAAEHAILIEHNTLFAELGIEFEPFGALQMRIIATPVHVKDISFQEILSQAATFLLERATLPKHELARLVHHDLRAQMACKAAVKAGDELTHLQIAQLLSDLSSVENRFTCPHGRPTCWLIRETEIEKQFKRRA
jgi:DNA mismatch repair protein MutL